MTINNKATIHKNNSLANIDTTKHTPKRAPYKIELCLAELLTRGEAGLFELEALQAYGDTALHSTISTLANSHGFTFRRLDHRHTNQFGLVVHFTRYILTDDEQIDKAKSQLKHYRTKRGLAA